MDVNGVYKPTRSASLSPTNQSMHSVFLEKTESPCFTPNSPLASSPVNGTPQMSLSQFLSSDQNDCILNPEHLQFKLNPPTLGVSTLSMEYVYEIATRLLFLTVDRTILVLIKRTKNVLRKLWRVAVREKISIDFLELFNSKVTTGAVLEETFVPFL